MAGAARSLSRCSLHAIGRLQSNKAAEAVAAVRRDPFAGSRSLLDALVREAEKAGRAPSVYIQVNIGEEEQKGGCAIDDVGALIARSARLPSRSPG